MYLNTAVHFIGILAILITISHTIISLRPQDYWKMTSTHLFQQRNVHIKHDRHLGNMHTRRAINMHTTSYDSGTFGKPAPDREEWYRDLLLEMVVYSSYKLATAKLASFDNS